MLARLTRIATVLLAPLLLASCVLAPGKFTSTLKIDADGSFAFTYVGEVIDAEPEGTDDTPSFDDADDKQTPAQKAKAKADAAAKKSAETEAKRRALAAALTKEAGYRKVAYMGKGKFLIDYAIAGKLSHDFIWPFNLDAEILIPFVAIELRQGGVVRVKAPAFANSNDSMKAIPGMSDLPTSGSAPSQLDGVFTLDTDAEIISQNNEEGAAAANGRRTISWKVTAQTKDAPAAVLKLAR